MWFVDINSSPENVHLGYAALRVRIRAYLTDVFIYVGVFLVGGISVGIAFENNSAARIAAFLVIVLFLLAYEPFMVSRYGGTFGHRSANLLIVRVQTGQRLPFWRALVRVLIKSCLGEWFLRNTRAFRA